MELDLHNNFYLVFFFYIFTKKKFKNISSRETKFLQYIRIHSIEKIPNIFRKFTHYHTLRIFPKLAGTLIY